MNAPLEYNQHESVKQEINPIQVLIIDDEIHFTEELKEYLQHIGMEAIETHSAEQGFEALKKNPFDLLILDVLLPDQNGIDILKKVKKLYPEMEVIVISAHGDMDTVIHAMRFGAIDYLRKPFRHVDIQISISRINKFLKLHRKIREIEAENALISESLHERIDRHFIGVSDTIKGVLEMAMTAARHPDTNVLITGESGTGKENIARIIHYDSPRKNHPLISVNSSAINESLMESEFFGHKKGSFTGAITDKKGFFEISNKGTLFLDEIADMPLNLQAKVLRAIEEKKVTRVGDTNQITSDFRIISATNHNPETLVQSGKFRLDLLHRLNTLHIHIPPLRERTEDIEPLFHYFLGLFVQKINRPAPVVPEALIDDLKQYHFPGNIRELKNMVERALILSKNPALTPEDFPQLASKEAKIGKTNDHLPTLRESETELIRRALKESNFNQKEAADILGITRDALIRRMKKYNIRIARMDA
jgi:DNA-binding NtrC family response regulator